MADMTAHRAQLVLQYCSSGMEEVKGKQCEVTGFSMVKQRLALDRAEVQAMTHPHDLALLLKDLQGCQLLHIVLASAVIQNLLGAVNEAAQTVALAERPPLHVAGSAHPLQCGHTQT